jgi:hypothetical protein
MMALDFELAQIVCAKIEGDRLDRGCCYLYLFLEAILLLLNLLVSSLVCLEK